MASFASSLIGLPFALENYFKYHRIQPKNPGNLLPPEIPDSFMHAIILCTYRYIIIYWHI